MSVRALSVVPGKPETAGVNDHPDPSPSEGSLVVQGLLMGVCGTVWRFTHPARRVRTSTSWFAR